MKTLQTEVLVCGGGCAGIAAALSSARSGAETLLIERAGFSGGIITTVGLPYFDGLIDKPSGRFVVKGIALELLRKLGIAKEGAKHIDDLPQELVTKYWGSMWIPNVEHFKILTDELILQQSDKLKVLYHSVACDVEVKEGRIAAVIVANKDGLVRIEARQVIDCTGDGDIAHWAGCPTISSTPLMPLTMHFRIGNVVPVAETKPAAKKVLIEAHEQGRLVNFYGPGLIFAFAKDECYVHATRVPANATDAADAADFTRAEIQGRKDAWTIFNDAALRSHDLARRGVAQGSRRNPRRNPDRHRWRKNFHRPPLVHRRDQRSLRPRWRLRRPRGRKGRCAQLSPPQGLPSALSLSYTASQF